MLSLLSSAVNTTVQTMKPALLVLMIILGVLVLSSILFTVLHAKSGSHSKTGIILLVLLYITTLIVLACTVICIKQYLTAKNIAENTTVPSSSTTAATTFATTEATVEETTEAITEPPTEPEPTYEPGATDQTSAEYWGLQWNIYTGDTAVDEYQRDVPITFGQADEYTTAEGVVTFRGNNYRNSASYGKANVVNKTIATKWNAKIGSYNNWTGSGWTGQPLVIRWDEETKAIMNLYEEKKTKEGLVEVIYATLDGNIYFYDMEDGSYTRDPLWVGMNFKGAGSLDPRGYPLMYVGAGDAVNGKAPCMFVISLIEGKVIYEQSARDSIAKRRWFALDSAPLVDAETDTLIWPCESGVLYTIKLNTQYDKTAGTISVSPENAAKIRYSAKTNRKLGSESSTLIVGQYLYFADNGGMFICMDLNTMKPVWVQDTYDDVNATPVFQWEKDGKGYIYTATSMEYGKGTTYIHKLDAATGEIIWEKTYSNVTFDAAVSGGVLSSPVLGKEGTNLEGLIVYSVSRTPTPGGGTLVALSTETGEVVWENKLTCYAWSSPVAVYTEDGTGYLVLCDSVGKVSLMDGSTGEVLSTLSAGSNIEASPAVFENTIVVGTRGQRVYAFEIS